MGSFQDLFIISFLFWLPFPVAAMGGFFIHAYLLFDAALYHQMHLRLRWRDWVHVRHLGSFFSSAKEMGLYRFMAALFALGTVHLGVAVWVGGDIMPPWFSLVSGMGALASLWAIPKQFIYATYHPFFLPHPRSSLQGKWQPVHKEGPRLATVNTEEKPHLIFLFLESFPAKSVNEATTPHFCRWREKGIYFSQFYANGTLTYRALIASLFGRPPGSTAVGLAPYVEAPLEGIPAFLRKKGYLTAFHHNGSLHFDQQDLFLERHFDVIADRKEIGGPISSPSWGVPDEYLMRYAADWLEKQRRPTFLSLFTITNHHPWIVPDGYAAPSGNRFHQTMHYTDHCFDLFLRLLQEKGLLDKSILFVLGDHGQPQGEHEGNFYNSRFLYEENVHVPLLILAKNAAPMKIDEVGSQVDLLGTVRDLFGEKGNSLLVSDPERTAFFQNPYSEGFIGCRKGPWKWIENRLTGQEELYNLQEDPGERTNVIGKGPSFKEKTHAYFAENDRFYSGLSKRGASRHDLDLSHSLVSDQELARHQFVRRANLDCCHLLTDAGIAAFLARCPELEELKLNGLFDLTDALFVPAPLRRLELAEANLITPETIARCCPYLEELTCSAASATQFPFRHLIRLKLFEASGITDAMLAEIARNNPHLGHLSLYGCEQITDEGLLALKGLPLERVWLFNALRVSAQGIAFLQSLALRSLIVDDFATC
jgi:arylsulfatase A-like enzyme